MAKDVIITPLDGDIQFKNSSGTDSGKIEQSGDDLVLTNAVGDILIGDGSSDVFIGDGVNNVDIVFEQNGSIRGEAGSSIDITLGSSDTDIIISGSTFNIDPDATFSGVITLAGSGVKSIQSGGDIALKTSTGEYALYGAANGNTNLYYNGVKHFQTDPDGVEVYGNIKLTGTATTTNAGRMIDFTGFDKEGTTDFSDRAYIQHTTNTGGHAGSVLVISSQNDSADGIAFLTNATSQLKHNNYTIWTSGNDGPTSGLAAQTAATATSATSASHAVNSDQLNGFTLARIDHAQAFHTFDNIDASGTQAKRYHIGRLYGCPAHWDGNWQNIEFNVTAEGYESGHLRYRLMGDYGGAGSQANMMDLYLKEASGPMVGRFRFVLGTPVDAGWDHSGQDTFYVDLYAEASHYSEWKINIKTYGHGTQNTNPTSGGAITVFYDSPTVTDISTFNEGHATIKHLTDEIYHEGHVPTYAEIGQMDYSNLTGTIPTWNQDTTGTATTASNAMLLDGADSSYFINTGGTAQTKTGDLTVDQLITTNNGNGTNVKIGDDAWIGDTNVANTIQITGNQDATKGYLVFGSSNDTALGRDGTGALTYGGNTIWHAGNDGPTSGLAAQTAATASYVAASDIDGSVNADTLDSINSTQFLRSDAADTASELITFQKGISQDGNAKFYTWRALDNSSNTSNLYFRIARVTSSQSSRFAIEIAGRSTSYSDTTIPAIGVIVGQLNNDNNYDIVFYNHKTATSQVVSEVGQVDVSTTATDIYIKTGQFSEISATGHISDGSITTYGGDSASATEPTNYVAATEVTVWNSGNDGPTSGLAAQTAATASYVAASDIDGSINADTLDSINSTQFLRSDESDTFTGTLTLNGQLDLSSTDTAANYIHLPRGGGITFYGDTSSHHGIFSRNNANGSADDILISSYNRIFFDLDSNNNNTNTEFSIGTHNGTTKIFNFSGETAHLTIGADDMTPMLDLLFDDHASGGGWDTRIQIGKSDDFASGVGVFPAYVPTGAYGMQIQSNSDGVFFGMEEYSTGNYRPVIQWGDDDTDSPFRIKHENGSELEITYNGDVTTSGDLTVSGGNIAVNNNNGGIQFSDVSSYWLRTATNWGIYWNTSSNQLQFHGAGSTKAFIDLDTGRIDTEEHVIANGNIYANGTGGFVFGTSTSEGEYIQRSGNDIRFVAGGSTRMTIDGDAGYVGIGTTSPGAPLTVEGSGSTLFNVQGSQGQLFSVTDDLTGDIFSVADISGIPILNINANGSSSFDGNVDIVGDTEVSGSLKVKFGNFDHNIDTSTAEEFKIHMSNDRLLHVSSSTEIKIGDIDALGDEMYFISNVNTSKLGFMSNGAEALMIDSNGFTIIPDRIVHAGDTNTYMQFHAADQWRVVTGNTERLEVNNTNTTVANTLITTAGMRLRSGASDQNGTGDSTSIPSTTVAEIMKFEGNSYTNGQYTTELVKIDRGGNLPLYFRQSKGTANSFSNLIRIGDHSNNSEIFHVFGSAKVDSDLTVGGVLYIDEIRDRTGQDLTITAGEASGHLTQTTHNDEIIRMAAEGGVRVFASSDNLSSGLNKQSILIDTNGNSVFGDQTALTRGGTARVSSKYTSTSGVALSMGLSDNNMSYVRQNGNGVFQWQTYNGGNSGQLHFQPYGGNVGIGSSSPSAKLDVNGDLKVDNGSIGINVTPSATDGRLDAGNDVVAYSTSDRRLKENIIPISEPLNKIKKINGVEFDWIPLTDREKRVIHGNEGHDVGVIAQEIEDILPVAVKQREHSKYKAVRYEKIIPLLIEAVKDQQDIIEELTNRLDKLENK